MRAHVHTRIHTHERTKGRLRDDSIVWLLQDSLVVNQPPLRYPPPQGFRATRIYSFIIKDSRKATRSRHSQADLEHCFDMLANGIHQFEPYSASSVADINRNISTQARSTFHVAPSHLRTGEPTHALTPTQVHVLA